jgi:hypothetical protein
VKAEGLFQIKGVLLCLETTQLKSTMQFSNKITVVEKILSPNTYSGAELVQSVQ